MAVFLISEKKILSLNKVYKSKAKIISTPVILKEKERQKFNGLCLSSVGNPSR